MGILMAVGAEVFPVAAVGRVVLVVAVPVVHGEEAALGRFEFPAAAGADQPVQGQGPLPVTLPDRQILLEVPDEFRRVFLR